MKQMFLRQQPPGVSIYFFLFLFGSLEKCRIFARINLNNYGNG